MSSRRTFLFAFLASCALLKAALESIAAAEAQTVEDSVEGVQFAIQSDPEATCDFCYSTAKQATMLVAIPNAAQVQVWQAYLPTPGWVVRNRLHICNNTVEWCNEFLAEMELPPSSEPPELTDDDVFGCTFCGVQSRATSLRGRHLIAAPGGTPCICDLCIERCNQTLS